MTKRRTLNGLGRTLTWLLPLCVITGLLALQGCSVNPATGARSFTAFLSPEEEREAGREADPRIRRQFGGAYADEQLQSYVDGIGQGLAAHAELPDLAFTFAVLNSPEVNAFALPGGYIYVTRGLLALADTEAELAGVLAHEIGHVTARHAAQRHSHAVVTQIGQALAKIADQPVLNSLFSAGSQIYLSGYSREQEFEADTLGVRYLMRAGYAPQGMASFLGKLRDHAILSGEISGSGQDPDQFQLLATHPRTADRVQRALTAAQVSPETGGRIARGPYLRRIDGLLYGDDPTRGVIHGRTFIHPGRGYRFSIPPDFTMRKTDDGLHISGPRGSRVAVDEVSVASSVLLEQYLTEVWAPALRLSGIERIIINGLAAATGYQLIKTKRGQAHLRLIVVRLQPRVLLRFQIITPANPPTTLNVALRRMTYSLERIPVARATDIRPSRLALFTVGPGDTLATVAARMPVGKFQTRRFKVLNGLGDGVTISPGMTVKLVTP